MKIILDNYTFVAASKTVTLTDYVTPPLERVLMITNVTDQIVIYQFNKQTKGATIAGNVLTLEFDTTTMSDTDDLMIIYDDPDIQLPVLAYGSDDGGTTPRVIKTDATGAVQVDIEFIPTVTVQATNLDIRDLSSATDSVTVTGTVTANAGTNLNTSALALEAGNLALIAASASVLDDWDESDRAKVNLIVGQAGITAGAGAVAANTPRVTHASDDPVVASLQLLDDVLIVDNAGFTDGTTKVSMGGYIYDEVAGTALTENDAAAARINLNRAQVHVLEDGATRGRWATVSATGELSVNTELPAAAALANDTASPTAPAVGAFLMGRDVGDGNWDMVTLIQAAPNLAAVDSGVLAMGMMAQFDDVSPTAITENQFGNVRMSSRRALLVEGVASGTVIPVTVATGQFADMLVDDAAFTAATSRVMPMGAFADESGTDSVDENDVGIPRMTLNRRLYTAHSVYEDVAHAAGEPLSGLGARRIDTLATSVDASGDWGTVNQTKEGALWVTLTPTLVSGLKTKNCSSEDTFTALTNSAQEISDSPGLLYGWVIHNPNTSTIYVHLYNTADGSVTVGTTAPKFPIVIPAGATANMVFPLGILFDTALSVSATTTGGGNTAPTTALEAAFFYFAP